MRILAALLLALVASLARGEELETKHATVVYTDARQLSQFNRNVRLRSLIFLIFDKKSVDAVQETRDKVDAIVERVQTILEMFPKDLRFRLVLLPHKEDVGTTYRQKFSRHGDFIAFYSPEDQTVYLSVEDASLTVLAHEVAHVVVDAYFDVPPPVRVHEVLAQYVESQLKP